MCGSRNLGLRTNPSDETIRIGPLAVRFLVTGAESHGSIASLELVVAAGARLMAPAHSHDHYEETIYGLEVVLTWTVDGQRIEAGPGQDVVHPPRRKPDWPATNQRAASPASTKTSNG